MFDCWYKNFSFNNLRLRRIYTWFWYLIAWGIQGMYVHQAWGFICFRGNFAEMFPPLIWVRLVSECCGMSMWSVYSAAISDHCTYDDQIYTFTYLGGNVPIDFIIEQEDRQTIKLGVFLTGAIFAITGIVLASCFLAFNIHFRKLRWLFFYKSNETQTTSPRVPWPALCPIMIIVKLKYKYEYIN